MPKFKESDIRPDNLKDEQEQYIVNDRNRLLEFRSEFTRVNCPACDSSESEPLFTKYEHITYDSCKKCGTVFVNPRPTPEHLEHCYAKSEVYWFWNKTIFPVSEQARKTRIFKPRVDKIISICRNYGLNNPSLVEVGAGFGTFGETALESGFFKNITVIEPTPDSAEMCRSRGLDVIEKPIEKVDKKELSVDILASFEVIEHLFSPYDLIKGCCDSLSPSGLFVVTCPNVRGFDLNTLREVSVGFDHEHINYFHPESLSILVERAGFEVLEIRTPGQLDAELVRKEILKKNFDVSENHFLKQILVDDWDRLGDAFQSFLSDNLLSSHMWLVARKP